MSDRATVPSPYQPADIAAQSNERGGRSVNQITTRDIDVVFQPLVDLATGWTVAYEALTRCKWTELRDPVTLFSRAQAENAVGKLGRTIREVAFQRCDDAALFINIHPRELNESWLVRPDDPIFFHDRAVYLEITESAAFNYFDQCVSVLREIQARGGGYLVVDDLGAGYSNLKRVIDLEPSVIKLDIALVRDIHKNRRQQILVKQVVNLCRELGADVVAEGIETMDELHAVRDTGAHYGQGYFFAKPSFPLPRASWPLERAAEPSSGRLARELSSGRIEI